MPRARLTESEDLVVGKKLRAPRARASSVVDTDKAVTPKRAPRKAVPKGTVSESAIVPEPVITPPHRKAPTPLAAERRTKVRTTKTFITVAVLCLMLTAAGVVVGMFDHGAIDVIAVVTNRNEKISRGEVRDANGQTVTNSVPVDSGYSGLHPAAPTTPTPVVTPPVDTAAVPAEIAGTSTATTTATSTESTTRDSALKPAL